MAICVCSLGVCIHNTCMILLCIYTYITLIIICNRKIVAIITHGVRVCLEILKIVEC